jgi:hypothetical protein
MTPQTPFDSLVNAIASLNLEEKRQLLEMLEDEIFQAEEDELEQDPIVLAEIEQARQAYKAGDYQTIQEYIASRATQAS